MVGSILLALVFFMSSQTGTVLYVPFETSVFVPQNRGIRFMNFRAQICKNKIHSRRISTYRVEVWALFRPGAIINFASWFWLQVISYFLQINFLVKKVHARERTCTFSRARGYFRVSSLSRYGLKKYRELVESRYCVTLTREIGRVPIFDRLEKGSPLFLLFRFCW